MVKALTFKGEKKPKKRKRANDEFDEDTQPADKQLVRAQDGEPEDDDDWVSAETIADVTGPVMLVLPTDPVTCLATDAMGKVFASKVENMVEGAPQSSEPHLVSQVWIATKVVGSESDLTLKGHHGRYLGCDKYGICSAMREAISPEETFKCLPASDEVGKFDLQTARATYLMVAAETDTATVRGDSAEHGESTRIRIRMQARFKPKHKVDKAEKVRAKISRKELEEEVGRRLEDDEVKKLKKARREGTYHEAMLDVKVKGKHDKFA